MPRRRRRAPFPWTPLLWILVAANVAAGLYWSPVTVLRRVRIESQEDDRPRLEHLVREWQGVPALQVDPFEVTSAVFARSDVADASFRRNVFGSAVLKVRHYRPVAVVDDTFQGCLASEGVFFQCPEPQRGLPRIDLPDVFLQPQATAMGTVSPVVLAKLSQEAQRMFANRPATVQVGTDGSYNIAVENSLVRLGTSADMDDKLARLRELMASDPSMFQKYGVINLMNPRNPVGVAR